MSKQARPASSTSRDSSAPSACEGNGREASVRAGVRYGILGGTFDPPHLAHLTIAQEVYTGLRLDRVWFIPAGQPPHKREREIASATDRVAMVRAAIADDERFALSTLETERDGPSYTVDTLWALRTIWRDDDWLCLIVGWDMLLDLPRWHDAPGVLAALNQIAAVHRPGFIAEADVLERLETQLPGLRAKLSLVPAPQLEIASTELRERVASSLPIRYLVPEAVRIYIEEHGLYTRKKMSAAGPFQQPDRGVGDEVP